MSNVNLPCGCEFQTGCNQWYRCPQHRVSSFITPTSPGASVVYQTCGTCGGSLTSFPCQNCKQCTYCEDTGNFEVEIITSVPNHASPKHIKETTWCPHCSEGEIWRELLDG